ncbi:MAG: hypothetical protein IJ206_09215 [Oscillospiraceae bacterium]|nr:hypothetical protein [Oscillospiraceae bacterium]
MKKLNIFRVYLDDGRNAFRVLVPATDAKDAAKWCEGNGDVIAVKQNTRENCDLVDIDLEHLAETLQKNAWGQDEIDVITRTLSRVGLERLR